MTSWPVKRRELPWVAVQKDYRLATVKGVEPLAELFGFSTFSLEDGVVYQTYSTTAAASSS